MVTNIGGMYAQRDETRDMLIEQHRTLYQAIIEGRAEDARTLSNRHIDYVQEVLAEVASGSEAEVNAAVAAAKAAFPKWAATAATERAKIMRKLGELIAQQVPEISETETRDCGQTISQTGKQLVPRAADNFHYFAEMCTRVDAHT